MPEPWTQERRVNGRVYPAGMLTPDEMKAVDKRNLPLGVRLAKP